MAKASKEDDIDASQKTSSTLFPTLLQAASPSRKRRLAEKEEKAEEPVCEEEKAEKAVEPVCACDTEFPDSIKLPLHRAHLPTELL